MFEDLISYITHLGFFYTHTGHDFCIFFNFLTDAGNNFFSLVHGHFMYNFLRLLRSLNGIVHIFKYAMLFSCRSVCVAGSWLGILIGISESPPVRL